MKPKTFSFVGADFEIGQTKRGLADSSRHFLKFLNSNSDVFSFAFENIGRVQNEILHKPISCSSKNDFAKLNLKAYQSLSDLACVGLSRSNQSLNLGGDHSVAISTIDATLRKYPNSHVIWIDAHGDTNCAEESLSGSFHGMPVYYLMNKSKRPQGLSWMASELRPDQITYIGIRDLDPFEENFLLEKKITFFTANDVKKFGMSNIIEMLRRSLKNFDHIHVSFDIDSLDPQYNLCTGVPVQAGLTIKDVEELFIFVKQTGKLVAADIVEINPQLAESQAQINHIYFIVSHFIETLFDTQYIIKGASAC